MPIINQREDVLALYEEARQKKWVIPCFCTENLTTSEAVLAAAAEYGAKTGQPDLPIIVAITVQYDHRHQSIFYTHSRRWDIGLKLFMADLEVLTSPGSPYEQLRVMIHLDHIQYDDDAELLGWDMTPYSSIMYDASTVSLEDNIRLTRRFVKEKGRDIVIEGACDEIVDATGEEKSELTSAAKARQYYDQTGVDLVVANLGTEHRANTDNLFYRGDLARQIRDELGYITVLHGTSSVPRSQVASLYADGVCKVNIWTALERDTSPLLFKDMVRHASKAAGPAAVKELIAEGLLSENCVLESASLDYYTTTYRQQIVYEQMKNMVMQYLELWYT